MHERDWGFGKDLARDKSLRFGGRACADPPAKRGDLVLDFSRLFILLEFHVLPFERLQILDLFSDCSLVDSDALFGDCASVAVGKLCTIRERASEVN